MSSKRKGDMNGVSKFILSLIILILQVGCIIMYYTTIENTDTHYSYEDKVYAENTSDTGTTKRLIRYNLLLSKNSELNNKNQGFDIKIHGFTISVNGNIFNYNKKRDMLEYLCKKYINNLGLNLEQVYNIEINKKVEAAPKVMNLSNFNNQDEIDFIDNELLGLDIIVNTREQEVVEPNTIIEDDKDLYIGEELKEPGVYGSKVVFKEITYNGTTIISENTKGEKLIKNSIPTIIKRGCKDPYKAGVAFLARPTSGGYLSSHFGEYRASSYHKGVDFAKDSGEDVFSALKGKVIFAGFNDGGYGNLIILEHDNNFKTYYAHLSKIFVKVGDTVEKGEAIGNVGNTGYSTGPHLHFELRVNEQPVNPIEYIIS